MHGNLLVAAKLIIENLPNQSVALPQIDFEKPIFAEGEELTPEGDFAGQINPTFFSAHGGFVYLKGCPLTPRELSISDIKKLETGAAGISGSRGSKLRKCRQQ